jgi:hypothetical protein
MPVPKYVPKSKHKEYRKKHRAIAKALMNDRVQSPYAVATARLRSQYEQKKSGKKKSSKRTK